MCVQKNITGTQKCNLTSLSLFHFLFCLALLQSFYPPFHMLSTWAVYVHVVKEVANIDEDEQNKQFSMN